MAAGMSGSSGRLRFGSVVTSGQSSFAQRDPGEDLAPDGKVPVAEAGADHVAAEAHPAAEHLVLSPKKTSEYSG